MRIIYGSILIWVSIIMVISYLLLNCINFKNKKYLRIIIGSILCIYGLLGSFTLPSYFFNRISQASWADIEFLKWASEKFSFSVNVLASISILVIISSLIIIYFSSINKISLEWSVVVVMLSQISLIIIAFIMGMYTINKRFDIASYILGVGYFNFLTLYGIYVCRWVFYYNMVDDKIPNKTTE
ncbi:hypothetical protein SH1V18_16460 [Vallitalea longa]|uniref:Uncharacterized protein n=1 Tax=Vallitalea longa TaxID=2936439 RepID=A0A9W5YAL3_9FIRM|nr:hypothetical protein [Vallitalea longa]GKX29166.1 hypothetical protein SH1V18_16460 [Vallitalea longa]